MTVKLSADNEQLCIFGDSLSIGSFKTKHGIDVQVAFNFAFSDETYPRYLVGEAVLAPYWGENQFPPADVKDYEPSKVLKDQFSNHIGCENLTNIAGDAHIALPLTWLSMIALNGSPAGVDTMLLEWTLEFFSRTFEITAALSRYPSESSLTLDVWFKRGVKTEFWFQFKVPPADAAKLFKVTESAPVA